MSRGRACSRGFSLIEVVVALAVIAAALGAAIKAVASHAGNQQRLEEKTLAHWVGMNRLTEVLLDPVGTDAIAESGTEQMGRTLWRWRVTTEDTGSAGVRRVVVAVSRGGEDVAIDRVAGFQRAPSP
jgi:general secretion pathway protein I